MDADFLVQKYFLGLPFTNDNLTSFKGTAMNLA